MTQFYFDPSRENEKHALPDAEVFHSDEYNDNLRIGDENYLDLYLEPGFYYWSIGLCRLPDSDPFGPFDTEQEAIEHAQADHNDGAVSAY